MSQIFGNTTGVSPHARRLLERIYRRRVPIDSIATPELVRSLVEATLEVKRRSALWSTAPALSRA